MGQQCIGEFVQYGFDRKRNQISCTDSPGSCERMVCECDLQFAKGIKKAVQSYDDRNHRFNGFKPDKRKYNFYSQKDLRSETKTFTRVSKTKRSRSVEMLS